MRCPSIPSGLPPIDNITGSWPERIRIFTPSTLVACPSVVSSSQIASYELPPSFLLLSSLTDRDTASIVSWHQQQSHPTAAGASHRYPPLPPNEFQSPEAIQLIIRSRIRQSSPSWSRASVRASSSVRQRLRLSARLRSLSTSPPPPAAAAHRSPAN